MTNRNLCERVGIETNSGQARMMANNIKEISTDMGIAEQDKQGEARLTTTAIAWGVVFLVTIFAYWPGLQGPFVLDDFSSLGALGNLGGVRDWDTFKAFVFGGTAGPTGRPLTLVSFLLDGNNWPTDPWPFKRTNLVIHLLNGALLGILTRESTNQIDTQKPSG